MDILKTTKTKIDFSFFKNNKKKKNLIQQIGLNIFIAFGILQLSLVSLQLYDFNKYVNDILVPKSTSVF